ncbi:hypothetical protein SAMN05216296_2705 [Pseudomonas pohangensis]|jgi:hypothetical protein|uniref:DUF2232 domain-containing protein n=1 Tax=Pseudomonas pohangensis TaxID=364197 RepID=A0A1H2H295_9PSED|nr:hypothetical protein [Pseudomonas pohangensis]SDU25943.1 hypothetical protein SAMN05216296_2705 [Pseudomonas pohangensis]
MRALADFIMRGRMQATLVVAAAAALPMLFWLSAAAGSLVLLRRGLSDALGILVWAMLPALVWWYFGEPRTLLVLLGTLGLALVLRTSTSWPRVLMLSIGLGVIYSLVLGSQFGELIAATVSELQALLPKMLEGVYEQLTAAEQAKLDSLLAPVMVGLMAAVLQIVSLLALLLGRYWQAQLYNPGGFGREFRALRLPAPMAIGLLLVMLVAPNFGVELAMLMPLCSVPLVFAGMALLHGLVTKGKLARFWLVGLYVSLLLFMQLVYPLLVVLAVVDSLIDFRGRLVSDSGAGPANGEG